LRSRDSIKNTPAWAPIALSEKKVSKLHQNVPPPKIPSENCDLYSWEMLCKAQETGKAVTIGWFSFILWFISQKLQLPLFFFSSLKERNFKRNCRRQLKI